MRRLAIIAATVIAVFSGPAQAMPNAFWIFGFHVPGKAGARSSIVVAPPVSQHRIAAVEPLADEMLSGSLSCIQVIFPTAPAQSPSGQAPSS